jgi:hypothetical protein
MIHKNQSEDVKVIASQLMGLNSIGILVPNFFHNTL